ncbi:MAG TPA: hypothetical protein VKE22_24755 [Haliangiales bacterium]|nr:hypothetical protein [Haliangiales bacterium]
MATTATDIGSDLKTLKDDMGQLMKQVIDKNKERLVEAKDDVFGKAGELAETAEQKIKSRPFLAVLIAFLVGLLFGAFAHKA